MRAQAWSARADFEKCARAECSREELAALNRRGGGGGDWWARHSALVIRHSWKGSVAARLVVRIEEASRHLASRHEAEWGCLLVVSDVHSPLPGRKRLIVLVQTLARLATDARRSVAGRFGVRVGCREVGARGALAVITLVECVADSAQAARKAGQPWHGVSSFFRLSQLPQWKCVLIRPRRAVRRLLLRRGRVRAVRTAPRPARLSSWLRPSRVRICGRRFRRRS